MSKSWLLFLTALLLMVMQFSSDLLLPSFPAIQQALSVSSADIQLTAAYSMIAFGASLFFWGPCSDCFGRRQVAIGGLLIFTFGSFFCATADSFLLFAIGRCLQGVGIGSAGALSPAIPKDIFSEKALTRAFALLSMAMGIYPILAQVIGGYLQAEWGWRSNFWGLCGLGLGLTALFVFTFPETNTYRTATRREFSISSALRQVLAIVKSPIFCGYVLCLTLVYTGEVAYNIIAPFVLQTQLGLTPIQHGWLALFTGGGLLLGASIAAKWHQSFSSKKFIFLGIILLSISVLTMQLLIFWDCYTVGSIVGPITLYMIGAGMIYPNCIASIMEHFPAQAGGVVGALMTALQMIGAGLSNSIVAFYQVEGQGPLSELLFAIALLTFFSFQMAANRRQPLL